MGNSQSSNIPTTMKRIVLAQPNKDISKAELKVEEIAMPVPKSGEVLIRVIAAPVNPSDYGEWTHVPPSTEEFEAKPAGHEGSGIVVASGGGVYANSIVGCNVGFVSNVKGQGSYQEYITVDAIKGVFPLPSTVKVEDAASHFVNPYTAAGFIDTVRARHHGTTTPGFVHTAAASQLGVMLVKLVAHLEATTGSSMNIINVVRREEQAATLRALGAKHIIISTQDGWQELLRQMIKELKIQIAFDAIAGEMSGILLDALPPKGTLYVYGRLSNEGCSGIQPLDLIYRKKRVEGWLLTNWLLAGDSMSMLLRIRAATALVHAGLEKEDGWSTSRFSDCTIHEMKDRFVEMVKDKGFTGNKLRIRFVEPEEAAATAAAATAAASASTAAANEK